MAVNPGSRGRAPLTLKLHDQSVHTQVVTF